MKYLLFNLNTGSGIEYVGNVISKWINEKINNDKFMEYKSQTNESSTINEIIKFSPDVIIINEIYPRIISPVFYYKKFNPSTKIILLAHSQNSLVMPNENSDPHLMNQYIFLMGLVGLCDKIFILDNKPFESKYNVSVKFCPSEPELFYNKTPWNERKRDFCFISNIHDLKLSKLFLENITQTKINIDVYGEIIKKFTKSDEYWRLFNNACQNNLNYKNVIPQEDIGSVLNDYQYLLMPHDGKETFCMILQQSIMCGTIPLLLNDEKLSGWNPIWANGLYHGIEDVYSYINNLKLINENKPDEGMNSLFISEEIKKRQDYNEFKKEFKELL